MTFCLNPKCKNPQNHDSATRCSSCGSKLLLRNRYRPIKILGQGGFGITYLAVDEDRLGTRCVIKQLLPKLEGNSARQQASLDKAVQLFNQEALRLCQLGEHPQIPTLLAYFEEENRLYLVQEYIEGQNLWQEMEEKGAFSEEQIRQVLQQLLPVLKFIHEHNIIHRDITPVNILRRQRDGLLMLIDFGIAKELTRTSLNQTGTKIGTQGYAPLEQLRSGQVYPASDIYSLGVTCINLLTHVKPERLYDPLKGWVWREYLAKRGGKISERLGQILDKMIKDMVTERYQTAEEVLKELNAAPVALAPPLPPPPPLLLTSPLTASATRSRSNSIGITPVPPRKPLSPPLIPTSKPQTRGWRCVHTLKGHSSIITSAAVSNNGLLLVSGSLDKMVKIWNLNTGELLRSLTGHADAVNSVAITPDGQTVVSCGDDGSIKLWSVSSSTLLASIPGHLRDVNAIAISRDGQILASGSEDRTVKIWELKAISNSQEIYPKRILSGRAGMVKCVAISPDGSLLASGGLDKNIYIWNLVNGELIDTLSGHLNSVNALAFSPDGKLLASGSKDKIIKLWNIANALQIRPFASLERNLIGHSDMINSLAFLPQGSILVSGSSDKTIKLWHLETGKLVGTIAGHLGAVNAVTVSPDGKTIVSGSWDKTLKVWRWFL